MRATTDALMGIRVLKFYGWEKPMMERIKGHRLGELEVSFLIFIYLGV